MYGTHSQERFSRIVQWSSVSERWLVSEEMTEVEVAGKKIYVIINNNFNRNIISSMRNTV